MTFLVDCKQRLCSSVDNAFAWIMRLLRWWGAPKRRSTAFSTRTCGNGPAVSSGVSTQEKTCGPTYLNLYKKPTSKTLERLLKIRKGKGVNPPRR